MFVTIAKLVAKRVLTAIPILLVVSALLFCVLRILPVDPAAMSLPPNATTQEVEAMRQEMGLDRPLYEQYAIWLGKLLHGDIGRSIHFRQDVTSLIGSTLPATIELALLAMVVATVFGIVGGLFLFYVRGTKAEPVIDFLSILLLSVPEFLWSLFLLLLFGVFFELLPFTAGSAPGWNVPT